MKKFYQTTFFISRMIGTWFFRCVSWFISTGYFILIPVRSAVSIRFYRALFPARGFPFHVLCAWRQYHNFTSVYLDRFLLNDGEITYKSEGWEHLTEAAKKGTGGVIIMSHMGNWEVAARLLRAGGMKLLLFMGRKAKEQIEKLQKDDLARDGVKIIAADEGAGSPFDILEAVTFLQEGGLVSMTGDRIWRPEQRSVTADFLGHEVRIPEAPHILALLSGSPLFIFFAFREGPRKYRFVISEPIFVTAESRRLKGQALQKSAERYLRLLENAVRTHPAEWYHFEPFLGKKQGRA